MQFKHVTLEFDGHVAILKLDHQEVMNAVSIDMLGGLAEALDAIDDKRDEVRCLVLTGAGRAFCTGANLQAATNRSRARATPARRWKPDSIRSCGACAICIARS
jgi:2-(1,2-epoxy-1,2-dihydrophenyl)acetyl-CoA isomerase